MFLKDNIVIILEIQHRETVGKYLGIQNIIFLERSS